MHSFKTVTGTSKWFLGQVPWCKCFSQECLINSQPKIESIELRSPLTHKLWHLSCFSLQRTLAEKLPEGNTVQSFLFNNTAGEILEGTMTEHSTTRTVNKSAARVWELKRGRDKKRGTAKMWRCLFSYALMIMKGWTRFCHLQTSLVFVYLQCPSDEVLVSYKLYSSLSVCPWLLCVQHEIRVLREWEAGTWFLDSGSKRQGVCAGRGGMYLQRLWISTSVVTKKEKNTLT